MPDDIPFVSRSVEVFWVAADLVPTALTLFVGNRVYYRLTPSIYVRFGRAIDQQAEARSGDGIALGGIYRAAEVLAELGDWINRHHTPDELRAAYDRPDPLPPAPTLPTITEPEPAPCHASPKPSACVPSRPGRTNARRRTRAATRERGSDCESLF
jgi:hypothetical protein